MKNKIDIQQYLMDEVYDKWRELEKENSHITKNEVLKLFDKKYSVAVKLGNLNYQIENGGISQWIFNRYMEEDILDLKEYTNYAKEKDVENIGILEEVIQPIIKNYTFLSKEVEVECDCCYGSGVDDEGEECWKCYGEGVIYVDKIEYMTDYENYDYEEDKFFSLNQEDRFKLFEDIIKLYE